MNPRIAELHVATCRLARIAAAAAALAIAPSSGAAPPAAPLAQEPVRPEQAFGDRIEVSRVIVDVRVIDGRGHAVDGLEPSDFAVAIDGRPAEVEAVEACGAPAVPAEQPPAQDVAPAPAEPATSAVPTAPASDLLVIFLQSADFHMETKAIGHLRMLPRLEEMVDGLAPGQRAAVLRYGGSLRLETDFTADSDRLRRALRRAVLGRPRPEPEPAVDAPSLAAALDPERARRAATPERALAAAADALAPLPGSKAIVFVGWGLAERPDDWLEMRAALAEARAPVFVLDVTSADAHLLEGALRHLAHVSGGFYGSGYHFPRAVVRRLEWAIEGRCTLIVRAERLPPGVHPLDVRLAPGAGNLGRSVLAADAVRVTR